MRKLKKCAKVRLGFGAKAEWCKSNKLAASLYFPQTTRLSAPVSVCSEAHPALVEVRGVLQHWKILPSASLRMHDVRFLRAEENACVVRVWMAEEELWTFSIMWLVYRVHCRDASGDNLSVHHGITQKALPRKRNFVSNVHSMKNTSPARTLQ